MCSSGINGERELRRQLANPGSPGKMAVKTEYVCMCVCQDKKVFTVSGPYPSLRASLRRRGWVEKINSASALTEATRLSANGDDDDTQFYYYYYYYYYYLVPKAPLIPRARKKMVRKCKRWNDH